MTIVTLNDRISKAEEKIAKKTATIAKKTALIEKKNAQIEKATDENTRYWLVCDTNHLREDIIRLESEIKETGVTLEKYRKQLAGEIERERTLIRDVPEQLKTLQAELVERWDKYDADWQAHLIKCYKEMTTREFFNAFHRSGYEFMYKTEKQIHDGNVEDAKNAIINLLYRVRDIVGTVTDWGRLEISGGVLNGYVAGTEGRCVVETIGAGGYNIQRYHLRVLVKPIN